MSDRDKLNRYFKNRGGYKPKNDREDSWNEDMLQKNIVAYLKEHHPNLMFCSDMSGAHLSKSQGAKFASFRSDEYKEPDMSFYDERWGVLKLELKIAGTTIYTQKGALVANKHIREQANTLRKLRKCGVTCDFGIGYVDSIGKINQWLEKGKFDYLLK